jgi:hypothetical protein
MRSGHVIEPVVAAVITGFVSALGTFISLGAFLGRRIDRLVEKFDRKLDGLDEKFDRKFDVLMVELLRHIREGHPPHQAA